MERTRKIITTFFIFLITMLTSSCSYNDEMKIIEELEDTGTKFFNLANTNDDDMTIVFFDNDNIISENGTSFDRPKRCISNTLGSSDCYMVKSGNVELLVDGGYQTMTSYGSINSNMEYNDEYVKEECQRNLLKKIASVISSDGVLDYLIVTHADYDHIASLIAKGGIFDAFRNKETISSVDGRTVKLQKIDCIIDFDSGLVKNFSDESLTKKSRLVSSDYYQAYVSQRDELISNGTSYCPASAFFENENLKKFNIEIHDDNKRISMPEDVIKRLEKTPAGSNVEYILSENYDNNVLTLKDKEYENEKLLSNEKGKIIQTTTNEGDYRYYYSLKFNNGELRILYNWHYDYIFHSSFNRNTNENDSTQTSDPSENVYDSQDANNISVCFEVVKDDFKFLSLGDLGKNGENGLIKYYKDTNVLSNISLFKLSHHGSVNNNENSAELFKIIKPKIIVLTGCALYKDSEWKSSEDDPIMSAMVGRTKLKQDLFKNISSAYLEDDGEPYIFCTNISATRQDNGRTIFESVPFYGDIKLYYHKNNIHVSHSYIGPIKAYISRNWNANYYQENKKEFVFHTREDNDILSFQDTDWFKNIGFEF